MGFNAFPMSGWVHLSLSLYLSLLLLFSLCDVGQPAVLPSFCSFFVPFSFVSSLYRRARRLCFE